MQIKKGLPTVDKNISDVFIYELISNFFRFGKCHESNFTFRVVGQIIDFDLAYKLS